MKDFFTALLKLLTKDAGPAADAQGPAGQEAGGADLYEQMEDMRDHFENAASLTGAEGLAGWNVPSDPDISELLRAAEEGYRKGIMKEIKELASFHSADVPVQYGDGTASVEKMISLAELDTVLSMVLDPKSPDTPDGDEGPRP